MAEPKVHVSRRIRIGVVVAASALFMLAIMNLILVSEQAPIVDPAERPPREWSAGGGASEAQGRESWAFTIDPRGRGEVHLDVDVPFVVAKTHVQGSADLVTRFGYFVEGREVATEERTFEARGQGNESEARSRTTSEAGTFGFGNDGLRVDVPEDQERFVLLMTWDWAYSGEPGTEASFRVKVDEVQVEGLDTGGLPLCGGLSCARLLVVMALIVQVAAFVWMGQAPREDRRAPFMRRQGHVERDVREFEVAEVDAFPAPKRRPGTLERKRL